MGDRPGLTDEPTVTAANDSVRTATPEDGNTPLAAKGLTARLAGATFTYGIGQILPQVINFLLIPVYTKCLSPEVNGLTDLCRKLGAVVLVIMRCGVTGAVSRFYHDHREGPELTDYVTTVARFVNVTSLLVGGLTLAVYPWLIAPYYPGLPLWPWVFLVVLTQAFAGNSDLQRRLLQAREQAGYTARLNVIVSLCTIGMTLLFVVVFRWGALGQLLPYTICGGVFFLQAYRYLWPNLRGRFRFDMLRSSLVYGISILPSHILGNLSLAIPASVLAIYDPTLKDVGLLAMANLLCSPLTVAMQAFGNAYYPVYFSVRKHEGEAGIRRLAETGHHVWTASVGLCLAAALLGPPLVVLMTDSRYHSAAPLMPIIALGFLAQSVYQLLGAELFYAKRVWLVPVASVGGLITVVVSANWAIPLYGPAGGAWAIVAMYGVTTGIAVWFSRMMVRLPHDWLGMAGTTLLAAIVYGIAMVIPGEQSWLRIVIGFGGVILFLATLATFGHPTWQAAMAVARRKAGTSRD